MRKGLFSVLLVILVSNVFGQGRMHPLFDSISNASQIDFYDLPFVKIYVHDVKKQVYYDSITSYESALSIAEYLYNYTNMPKQVDSSFCIDAKDRFNLAYKAILEDDKRTVNGNFLKYIIDSDKEYSAIVFHEGFYYSSSQMKRRTNANKAIAVGAVVLGGVLGGAGGIAGYMIANSTSKSILTLVIIHNTTKAIVYKEVFSFEVDMGDRPSYIVRDQIRSAYMRLLDSIQDSQRINDNKPKRKRKKDYY